jgi:hypothetical protein
LLTPRAHILGAEVIDEAVEHELGLELLLGVGKKNFFLFSNEF